VASSDTPVGNTSVGNTFDRNRCLVKKPTRSTSAGNIPM
jgi:hypothetical protein